MRVLNCSQVNRKPISIYTNCSLLTSRELFMGLKDVYPVDRWDIFRFALFIIPKQS